MCPSSCIAVKIEDADIIAAKMVKVMRENVCTVIIFIISIFIVIIMFVTHFRHLDI